MSDIEDGLDKAFEGFGDENENKLATEKVAEKPIEIEPKKTETKEEPPKEVIPPATLPVTTDENKEEEKVEPVTPPATPSEPTTPLTRDDVTSVITDLLSKERNSSKELETTTRDVLEAYYPDGLSNVLVDESSGKELRTPADVVAVTNGEMSTEEAAQWLMNEQFKLDKQVDKIRNDARAIAETTVSFKRDSMTVLQKYEPLFKQYPQLQQKVFDKLMKQVKVDKDKSVILSAPDVMEHYDDYLEPYQQAFEFATKQSATNPTGAPATPPPKPTAEDRMDEGGDGGATPPNDPNDFAQQVSKELAKGI